MKLNGDRFFRAANGFIILEISLEMGELYCVCTVSSEIEQ